MATKVVLQGERASAVWDDRWRAIYEALGVLCVERATDVEFDNASGDWHAFHLASGELIASGPNRTEVIDREVDWLENQWFKTTGTNQKESNPCHTP